MGYIPRSDAEFDSWQANFRAYVNANLAGLGLTATDPDVLAGDSFIGRWVNRRGEAGPLSETVSATIPG